MTASDDKATMKAELKARNEADAADELRLNEGKTGKGTRTSVGYSRGRNPQRVVFESFHEDKPDTLPSTTAEFLSLTGFPDDSLIVSFLIDGYNSYQYSLASNPVNELVDTSWPVEKQKQFIASVKTLAATLEISIEEAAGIIKSKMK